MPTPTHRSASGEDPLAIADGWLQVVSTHHRSPRQDVHPELPGLELVVFDLDGTLVEGSAWETLHAAMGVSNESNWLRYQRGEIDDHEFIASDIALWREREVHVEDLERILAATRVFDGAKRVVDALRSRGVATCIVSGGLDLMARRVCLELGIDMYVANGVRLKESGHVAGEGIVFVEIRDKGRVTREILRKLGVPRERAVAVGNSAYDVPMFRECAYGIAVNPSDDYVRRKARHVIEGTDLTRLLPLLGEGQPF